MNSDKKHIQYTAADIEQYLAGKLSQLEMHAMEKAALDDPFLAEAIEGYEGMKNTEWNNQLVTLREELAKKGTAAKVIPLHKTKTNWWKTAAAILVLGTATTLIYILTNDEPREKNAPQIAKTINVLSDSLKQPGNAVVPSVTASLNPTASATTEEIKANSELIVKTETAKKQAERYIPDPNAPQIKALEQNNTAAADVNTEKVIEPVPASANNPAAINSNDQVAGESNTAKNKAAARSMQETEAKSRQKNQANTLSKKETALNNFFTAQVVAPDNTPLPFTNISIKKENFGTYADSKGMVRLVSTDSILNIEVRSVGYSPKLYMLRTGQPPAKIILQEEDIAKKDTRIIGNAGVNSNTVSRRARLVTDSAVNVEPADGWENYNTYVANNLDIPEDMMNRDLRGEVEISFDVRSNGTISNIRVDKSLGAGYDEAAKRLILEGPQWKVKKGRKTSAKVKVQF
jgi:TonB family protein